MSDKYPHLLRANVIKLGEEYELAPGDFVAFPTPSVAHNMTNPFDVELIYMMGGEHLEHEIGDFPELGKRMIRNGKAIDIYNIADGESFGDA